jgi:hypothetical protein
MDKAADALVAFLEKAEEGVAARCACGCLLDTFDHFLSGREAVAVQTA